MTAKVKLTAARRRGLVVLAITGYARESNSTDGGRRHIYWQTVNWLVDEGLAFVDYPGPPRRLAITAAGMKLARTEGLVS